jgi:carbon storage regulator
MLVLSRKPGEKVVIDSGITISIVEVKGNRVRIGIDAPDHIGILRQELVCWQDEQQAETSQPKPTHRLASL